VSLSAASETEAASSSLVLVCVENTTIQSNIRLIEIEKKRNFITIRERSNDEN